jgi:hypothetical protein
LKELGEIIIDAEGHLLSFASTIAKGANNIIELTGNLRVSVSITDGGVRITEVSKGNEAEGSQLQFSFASKGAGD